MMKPLLSILLLTGCGYFAKHDAKKTDGVDLSGLRAKYETVYKEVEGGLDPETGWPSNTECDGLLWASIAGLTGMQVNISLAEYFPGEIHRRPYKACWTEELGDQGARSTISRDMLVAYMAYNWFKKDLAAFQRLADYGEKNDWIMGKPSHLVSRVFFGGNGIGALARALYVLSQGKDDRYYRRTGFLYPGVIDDFERHIQTQGILLQDSIDNAYRGLSLTAINDEMFTRLQENAAAFPLDPLFAAALGRFTGDQKEAHFLLMQEDLPCPSYARGEKPETYCKLIWLQAAKIVMGE